MRLAFHEENDAAEFFKAAAAELRSKGLLFKDERTKQWIKDPPSDSESDSTCSESDKEETMVLYDAPGEMDQEAISASLQSANFSISRLSRMGWNLGTPHGAAWRLTGTGLLGRSGCILHDADQDITMTLISLSGYQDIKSSFDKPSAAGKGRGKGTCARAAASTLLEK